MGLWTKEEISGDIAGDALKALAQRLVGNLETRLGTIAAVKAELVAQLDAYAAAQAPDPPVSGDGKKGWMLSMHQGVALVNPVLFLQLMLKDKPDRANFAIYAPDPLRREHWRYHGSVMAWDFSRYDNRYGVGFWFTCLGQHRCAPGDILIGEDLRCVVKEVQWDEDSTWRVHCTAVDPASAEGRFDPHVDAPLPRPCGDAALKVT